MFRKFFRILFGGSHREELVRQAQEDRLFASRQNSAIIDQKINYLDRLVRQFQEDTRR